MDPGIIIALIALAGSGAVATSTVVASIRSSRSGDKRAETEAKEAEANRAVTYAEMDEKVRTHVNERMKELMAENKELRTENRDSLEQRDILEREKSELNIRLLAIERSERETRKTLRDFILGLFDWDRGGRVGPMPMPSPPEVMARLEIEIPPATPPVV